MVTKKVHHEELLGKSTFELTTLNSRRVTMRLMKYLCGISFSFWLTVACTEQDVPASSQNHPPNKPTLSATSNNIQSGESITISSASSDPDGDNISYLWSATGGSFNQTDEPTVIWTSPSVTESSTYTITLVVQDIHGSSNSNSINIVVMPQFSSVTGVWELETRSGFGNNEFTASMSVNELNLTQTNQLAPGYTSDVYTVTGNFSGFGWLIQRKSDGTLYPLQNASGSIVDGSINASTTSHNLQFHLGSQNYVIRGVAPAYASMSGDVTLTINMTNLYGTSDGTITLTGMWDASRK